MILCEMCTFFIYIDYIRLWKVQFLRIKVSELSIICLFLHFFKISNKKQNFFFFAQRGYKSKKKSHIETTLIVLLTTAFQLLYIFFSYPEALLPSPLCGVSGGTGDPPDSSDGVFDKNRLPPNSETNVIGELFLYFFLSIFLVFLFVLKR